MNKLKIGSHVSMSGEGMLLNAVNEAIEYGENTFMIYTGAPQNTKRKPITDYNLDKSIKLMKKNDMTQKDIVVHAPYIINLANTVRKHTFEFGIEFLKSEIDRAEYIGSPNLILHPGSHLGVGIQKGLDSIIDGLNRIISINQNINIALETMSGKGSECCYEFEQIKYIISNVKYNKNITVCFDTCHVWDSGYDIVNKYEEVINKFEKIIGIDKISVFHINDSKNDCGSKKDRHENIGFGKIGFEALLRIIYDDRFENIPKILETPYIDKKFAPYKLEISMIKNKKFDRKLKEEIEENANKI